MILSSSREDGPASSPRRYTPGGRCTPGGRYAAELDVAREAARAAGKLLLERFRTGVIAEFKGHRDVVTAADRDSEDLVRGIIAEAFGDDVVVGEEGDQPPESAVAGRRRWYVDPLDGTTNFVKGQDRWAVSIAFCDDDDVFGACAIYRPCSDEEYIAARGAGAFRDEQPLLRGDDPELADALVLLGPMGGPASPMQERPHAIAELARAALSVRITGSTVSDLADVAGGRADVHLGQRQGRWDTAAGTLLGREAGLVVTDMTGADLRGPGDNLIVATPAVHAFTLAALRADASKAVG